MTKQSHPLANAIKPLVDAVGGAIVDPGDAGEGDIILTWDNEPAVAVRLIDLVSLPRLVAGVEEQLGSPLAKLERADKQRAVRMLEERGAFRLRRSIEEVGKIMGVSRITIYNYLSARKR